MKWYRWGSAGVVFLFLSTDLFKAEGVKSREWLDLQWQRLEDVKNAPLEEQLESLRYALVGVGELRKRSSEEERLYERVQAMLVETPGHAYYFRDHILELKGRAFENGEPQKEPAYTQYLRERMWALQVLEHLPSLETMEVMMEFLDDNDKPVGRESPRYYKPLSEYVGRFLRNLVQEYPYPEMNWIEWRDEIRAKKRTFRFKGSEVRYYFDGPVADVGEIRSPKGGRDRALPGSSGRRGEEISTGGGEKERKTRSIVTWVAVIVLVTAVLLFLHLRRRKAKEL